MAAAAMTRGNVEIEGVKPAHIGAVISKLTEAGASIKLGEDSIKISMKGRPSGTDIVTSPFPGFPTDMQAQFMAVMSIADGASVIRETIFENRFHARS